jgi:hypothetical protein
MQLNFKSPIWTVLITQFVALAVGYIELHHKVKFHDAWIRRRIDVLETQRIRLAELEIDELERTYGRFQQGNQVCIGE